MTEFSTGQTAQTANTAIKLSLKTRDAAQKCAVLWFQDILERKLYRDLGYSTINQYAKQELGFSKSHIGDFLQLCRTFKKLPLVKEAVKSGKLTYTSARVLARVANEKNQEAWTDFAVNNTRRELEQEVRLARREVEDKARSQPSLIPELTPEPSERRPAAVVPVRVSMEMSPTQLARYEHLWELVRKQRHVAADKVEALLEIMESFVAGHSETKRSARADLSSVSKPPVQIHIHKCEECARATVQTSKGELEISKEEQAKAECDYQISKPGMRNTASIAPLVRRQALANARYRCQKPGCDHTRFLEIHHITPRSQGGTNHPDNLQVLCSSCHGLIHHYDWNMAGFLVKSPGNSYKWQNSSETRPISRIFSLSHYSPIHPAERFLSPWPRNAISYSGPPVTSTTARQP